VRVVATQRIASDDPAFLGRVDPGDRLGSAIAGLGDLNDDGSQDLAIGAPFADDGDPDAGAVWIVLRDALGVRFAHRIDAFALPGGTLLGAGSTFGFALARMGPGDAPGRVRLAVGAPGLSDAASAETAEGRVLVLEIDGDGAVHEASTIDPGAFTLWRAFGASLASGTGLTGAPALLVGAPRPSLAFVGPGAVFPVAPDGTVGNAVTAGTQGFVGEGLSRGDRFGSSVAMAVLGDDEVPEWVVAAEGTDAPRAMTPDDDGTILGETVVPVFFDRPPFERGPDYVGTMGLARLPDVDGDGVDELAVGARTPGPTTAPRGHGVWLLAFVENGEVRARQRLDRRAAGFAGEHEPGDDFGAAVASPGDVDGDGVDELAVGAPGDAARGQDSGAVWLMHLEPGPTLPASR